MDYQHETLAAGRWHTMTLAEQLGNVGSEVSRARKAQGKDAPRYEAAMVRAFELLDLTLADPRWQKARRLKEISRARELLGDAYYGGTSYGSNLEDLDRYFYYFAIAARNPFSTQIVA